MTILWLTGLYLSARAGWERTRQRPGTVDEFAALAGGFVWVVVVVAIVGTTI